MDKFILRGDLSEEIRKQYHKIAEVYKCIRKVDEMGVVSDYVIRLVFPNRIADIEEFLQDGMTAKVILRLTDMKGNIIRKEEFKRFVDAEREAMK